MKRLITLTAFAAALGLLALQAQHDPNGLPKQKQLRQALIQAQKQNQALKSRVAQLRLKMEAFRRRPEVRRQAIRDELHYLAPNEIILDLGQATPSPKATAHAP